jgi:hypothetical protein
MKNLAPIVLFVYKRPRHARQTVNALLANELADKSDLIIFADGPKSEKDAGAVREVREYIHSIKGFKSIKINERNVNRGLANSIIGGVTKVVNEYGRIIVLEDDMVTSPYFLRYMNEALDIYKDEEKVISVHGYMHPVKGKLPETFFLKGADCWGWATWKRGWDLFEPDGEELLKRFSRKQIKEFDFNNSFPFYKMLKDQVDGKIDSWAIRWYASAFLQNRLTLRPCKSLLKNIGMDNSGTHCGSRKGFDIDLNREPVNLRKIVIAQSDYGRYLFSKYYKTIRIPFFRRCIYKIRYTFTKLKK